MSLGTSIQGPDVLKEADLAPLAERLGGHRLARAEGLTRLSGGASQETWSFVLVKGTEREPLVLRRCPPGRDRHPTATPPEVEAEVVRAMALAGIPVAPVRTMLRPEDGLGRGFVSTLIEGETLAPRILKDPALAAARDTLPAEIGRALAGIHRLAPSAMPPLRHLGIGAVLDEFRLWLDRLTRPRPVFEYALRWLHEHRCPEPAATIVHGDFRLGNLIVGTDGIRAVLDWEVVHLGDPMEDLAWPCLTPWRFGRVDRPVAGLGTREQLFAAYAAAGGIVEEERVRWWEIAGSLRWGLICAEGANLFAAGADRTIERAMITRRASESECDVLRLIEGLD